MFRGAVLLLVGCAVCWGEDPPQVEEVTIGMGSFFKAMTTFQEADLALLKIQQGYSGGFRKSPTYDQVMHGSTGHALVLNIAYNPDKTSLKSILKVFWHGHDPTSLHQQGDYVGSQYRSVLFFRSADQNATMHATKDDLLEETDNSASLKVDDDGHAEALTGRQHLADHPRKVVTEIVPFEQFWAAEANLLDIAPSVEEKIQKEHEEFVKKHALEKKARQDVAEEGDPNELERKRAEKEAEKEEKDAEKENEMDVI